VAMHLLAAPRHNSKTAKLAATNGDPRMPSNTFRCILIRIKPGVIECQTSKPTASPVRVGERVRFQVFLH
jgi:hypothetical protein